MPGTDQSDRPPDDPARPRSSRTEPPGAGDSSSLPKETINLRSIARVRLRPHARRRPARADPSAPPPGDRHRAGQGVDEIEQHPHQLNHARTVPGSDAATGHRLTAPAPLNRPPQLLRGAGGPPASRRRCNQHSTALREGRCNSWQPAGVLTGLPEDASPPRHAKAGCCRASSRGWRAAWCAAGAARGKGAAGSRAA
jgi:hypothetical protein